MEEKAIVAGPLFLPEAGEADKPTEGSGRLAACGVPAAVVELDAFGDWASRFALALCDAVSCAEVAAPTSPA